MNFATIQAEAMDDLTYTYSSDSYELVSVADAAIQNQSSYFKHFTDGASTSQEYTYDLSGNLIQDDNRHISLAYNVLGLPMSITDDLNNSYRALFTYDAAGNKLKKFYDRPPCAPCDEPEYAMDYLGNFVFRDGQIDHIIHPEGIIRPTPTNASNQTDFVYDYFIKDYLGNVRAIITEEDATYTDKYLATMEEVYAEYEEQVFDNLDESRELLPNGFPLTGSQTVNEYVARLAATSQAQIGPSIVTQTKNGDKISLSAYSYYAEETPNATYNNVGILVEEILMALVGAGASTLDHIYTDGQLMSIASATDGVSYYDALEDWLSNPNIINPNTLNKPNAYIIYMQYDNTMKFQPLNSGVIQVQTANELETHMLNDIPVSQDGYMHVYVTNASSVEVSFDDLLVQQMKGKVRQFNDYYPYGLSISGFNKDQDDYIYKYTSKELQTAELAPTTGTGIEMFDFHARFYDPQLGRWFKPDPAMQFSNPYLGIGNNPVMYVDPDGEFIVPMLIGAGISVLTNGISNTTNGQGFFDNAGKAALIGGIGGAFSFGIGQAAMGMSGIGKLAFQTAAHGHLGGMMSGMSGGDYGSGFLAGAMGSLAGAGTGAALKGVESKFLMGAATVGSGALSGGIGAEIAGGDFWDGARNGAISSGLNHAIHAGYLGKGLMMSSITGRTRHLFGPDAYSVSGTAEASFGGTVAGEKTGIYITRGKDQGFHSLTDLGYGMLTDIQASVGVEVSDYYYTGTKSNLALSTFKGIRTEANFNVTVLPFVSGGFTGSYANVDYGTQRLYSVGFTLTLGASAFDPVFLPFTFGLNQGETW